MDDKEYKAFELLRLQGNTIEEATFKLGRGRNYSYEHGYTERFNEDHPEFSKPKPVRHVYHPPHTFKDADPTLANQVQQAPTRAEKLALIEGYRRKLVAEFGKTLMDVPEDEPRLKALQLANQSLSSAE
ncbi:hypothetical protein [Pediococcus pentosaceus]|uniref:hypothetical protein n=1 Tax=Pediococcus pentosaceus TaxID=1255 RepID=UPI003981FD64